MKKSYALLFAIAIYTGSFAQTYFPMLDNTSNTWYYSANLMPVRTSQQAIINCTYGNFSSFTSNTLMTTGDTLLNAINYKILIQEEFNQPFSDCTFGFLREDTASQKIYFQDNQSGPEEILYDFSMLPGDSIYLNFFQSFGVYTTGYYHLDSIGSVTIPAGSRRLFYLNNHNVPTQFPLEWIESVGHPGHLVYTKSANFDGMLFMVFCMDNISRNFYQQLICFEHSSQKVYFDSCAHAQAVNNLCFFYADSCNFWNICGSVEEVGDIHSFTVSHNPVQLNSQVVIDANRETYAEVIIYGMEGRQLYKSDPLPIHPGNNKFPLRTTQYRYGTYVVKLRFKNGSLYKKMVIVN